MLLLEMSSSMSRLSGLLINLLLNLWAGLPLTLKGGSELSKMILLGVIVVPGAFKEML